MYLRRRKLRGVDDATSGSSSRHAQIACNETLRNGTPMMSFCESSFPNSETSPINCLLIDMLVACKLHFKATLLTDTSRTPPASQNEAKINETTNEVNSHNVISLAEAETFPSSCLPIDVPVARKLHFGATLLPDTSNPPARQNKGKINGIESTKLTQASNEQQKRKRDHMSSPVKEKVRQSFKKDVDIKGESESVVANFPKDKLEQKTLPNFKSFIVQEEEGSGGYGIVYRATRKSDQKMFAIKCPHANAYRHHVTNELKMLKRFGMLKRVCSLLTSLLSFNYSLRGLNMILCGAQRLRLFGDNQHSTRIAFVEFVMVESAIAALNYRDAILGSLPLRFSPSKTPVRPRSPRPYLN